jgi:hypothetical protein
MYNHQKKAAAIMKDASQYGIKIAVRDDNTLQFDGYTGSASVQKALQRKMDTHNKNVQEGQTNAQ